MTRRKSEPGRLTLRLGEMYAHVKALALRKNMTPSVWIASLIEAKLKQVQMALKAKRKR